MFLFVNTESNMLRRIWLNWIEYWDLTKKINKVLMIDETQIKKINQRRKTKKRKRKINQRWKKKKRKRKINKKKRILGVEPQTHAWQMLIYTVETRELWNFCRAISIYYVFVCSIQKKTFGPLKFGGPAQ